MSKENGIGRVVAVCMSPEHGFPTYPRKSVFVGPLGIPDDAHSGLWRESFTKPGTHKRNDRPICIVSEEVRQQMNVDLGLHMQHGDFNEQIVVEELGDLGDIPIGAIITFTTGVLLQVVDYAYPCKKLEAHNGPGLIQALAEKRDGTVYSKRGILCTVYETGSLQAGDRLLVSR